MDQLEDKIMDLNPTLWRTCRILSGRTRLALLRRVVRRPGQTVSQLAKAEGISLPRTSQELRRLQSRGLLQAVRTGLFVKYHPIPDPQVAMAKPLLQALQEAFSRFPASADDQGILIAAGLSHIRRLAIVRELRKEPRDIPGLSARTRIPGRALWRHLRLLEQGGWVQREGAVWEIAPNDYPLAKCLMGLL
jgi:DNA-binding HxlR family transcriptional regulator